MTKPIAILLTLAMFAAASCSTPSSTHLTRSGIDPAKFVSEVDGKATALYTLTNSSGTELCITNYGGRMVSLMVPDRNNELVDVILGHDSIADYINIDGNFGALIGRYGNRIDQGRFTLDSITYQLPQNNFGHCLHGGDKGFHHSVWDAQQLSDSVLSLKLASADGDEGFPGNIDVTVTYTLTADNAVVIDYAATTDSPTILNLTNHAYFNLTGNHANNILSETVWFDADGFTPIDSTFITSGAILPVSGTPFDFSEPKTIGRDIESSDPQLSNGRGYDHNMVLREGRDINLPAAIVVDSITGIRLEVFTTEPGIQFYTGNFLDGSVKGKQGIAYPHRAAFCLETQHFPDSPNKPHWPSVVVRPGDSYRSRCIYRFR